MTSVVKDELSRVPVVKPCCRKAEVSTLLRFAGGLTLTSGRIVIEAELDTAAGAGRARARARGGVRWRSAERACGGGGGEGRAWRGVGVGSGDGELVAVRGEAGSG